MESTPTVVVKVHWLIGNEYEVLYYLIEMTVVSKSFLTFNDVVAVCATTIEELKYRNPLTTLCSVSM